MTLSSDKRKKNQKPKIEKDVVTKRKKAYYIVLFKNLPILKLVLCSNFTHAPNNYNKLVFGPKIK